MKVRIMFDSTSYKMLCGRCMHTYSPHDDIVPSSFRLNTQEFSDGPKLG